MFSWDSYQNIQVCVGPFCNCTWIFFMSVALIVVEIFAFLHGTLLLLKDKYPNFEVGLKCILIVNPYLLACSYIK